MNQRLHTLCILMGPPGSGKGSLARKCATERDWLQLSTGDLCRTHIAQGTGIGQQIDFLIKNGKLIDDSLMLKMVRDWLQVEYQKAPVIILDGFPRTLPQAEALERLMKEQLSKSLQPIVIELDLADALATERIVHRMVCSQLACGAIYHVNQTVRCLACGADLVRRSDDAQLEIIRGRMATYRDSADRLISWYRKCGYPVEKLDATKPAEAVFEDFCHVLQKRLI